MDKLGLKIFVCLGLWLFFAQGTGAFASTPKAIQVEKNLDFEFQESSSEGLVYIDQINILKINPGLEKESPVISFSFFPNTSVVPERKKGNSTLYNFFLRDQKHSLKIQIFPFHSFW